jgi:hypothetical protein
MKASVFVAACTLWLCAIPEAYCGESKQSSPQPTETIEVGEFTYPVDRLESRPSLISLFTRQAADTGIKIRIVSCEEIISITAGRDHSTAGLCRIEAGRKQQSIMICGDELAGHFELKATPPLKMGRRALATFLAENCVGG